MAALDGRKKQMEAADIIEILKKQLAVVAGGRDKYGRPIITLASQNDGVDYTLDDVVHTFCYLSTLYEDDSKKVYFLIIIDLRHGLGKKLQMILKAIQVSLLGRLNKIILIRGDSFRDKSKSNVDLKKEKELLDCEIHIMNIHKLHQLINPSQLIAPLGGTQTYIHTQWLQKRMMVEECVKQSAAAIRHLETTLVKMNDHCHMMTKTNAQEMWEQNQYEFQETWQVSDAVLQAGFVVLEELEMDGDSGFRSNEEANLDTKKTIKQVKGCLEKVQQQTERLQEFWTSMELSLIQMMEFQEIEKNFHNVIDWILGPAEDLLCSQQGIGTSFQSADELRKKHEQVEIACTNIYGVYAELRHKADEMIQEGHVAASAIQVQKEYMDTVCRSFAHRLERRRNLLITSAYFHRLVLEIFQKFCNLFDVLQEEWKLTTYEDCERLLESIGMMHENIKSAADQASYESERLLDLIALPVKNASGQDVTPNFTSAVMHVKRLSAQVEERKKQVDEAVQVRTLRIHQMVKVFVCEQDAQQAIRWLRDLCDALVRSHFLIGCCPDETEALRKQHRTFEGTAQQTYEYGRQLLHAALILRRSCKMSYDTNTAFGRLLHQTWRKFLVGCKERSLRLQACLRFYENVDQLLHEFRGMANPSFTADPKRLNTAIQDLLQVILMGKGLLERIQSPVITWIGADKPPSDESAAESIQLKISEVESKMEELSMERSRRDSELSATTTTSSAKMESFHTAGSSTMVEDWKSLTSEEWRTAASEATSADELDEFYSAEENSSLDNGRDKSETVLTPVPEQSLSSTLSSRPGVKLVMKSVSSSTQKVSRVSISRAFGEEVSMTQESRTKKSVAEHSQEVLGGLPENFEELVLSLGGPLSSGSLPLTFDIKTEETVPTKSLADDKEVHVGESSGDLKETKYSSEVIEMSPGPPQFSSSPLPTTEKVLQMSMSHTTEIQKMVTRGSVEEGISIGDEASGVSEELAALLGGSLLATESTSGASKDETHDGTEERSSRPEDPLLRQLKEVGDHVCQMIESIVLK